MNAISGLVKYGRKEILRYFRPDSCIASTAISIDVLRHFGIKAEPIPILVRVYNKAFVERMEIEGNWPSEELFSIWQRDYGAYGIGIGVENSEKDSAGHLAILADGQLIDLSVDQASRPKFGINLEPFCIEWNDPNVSLVCHSECGCAMLVERTPAVRGYLKSNDWLLESRRREPVRNIIRLIGG